MNQVREALNKDNNVERIKCFGYSIEEINYYIDFAEAFIPMVDNPLKINRKFWGDETEGAVRKEIFRTLS